MLLRSSLLALGLVACASAEAQPPLQPSEVLLGLGDNCWRADLGSGTTDTHCFSVARGGKVVMDVHKVRTRSGGVVYEGATLYRLEPSSGVVRYDYYNSNGDLLSGYAKRDGQTIRFPDKADGAGDLVWRLKPESYETSQGDGVVHVFTKIGPAPEGAF